jgi:hypothetical protein
MPPALAVGYLTAAESPFTCSVALRPAALRSASHRTRRRAGWQQARTNRACLEAEGDGCRGGSAKDEGGTEAGEAPSGGPHHRMPLRWRRNLPALVRVRPNVLRRGVECCGVTWYTRSRRRVVALRAPPRKAHATLVNARRWPARVKRPRFWDDIPQFSPNSVPRPIWRSGAPSVPVQFFVSRPKSEAAVAGRHQVAVRPEEELPVWPPIRRCGVATAAVILYSRSESKSSTRAGA